MAASSTKIQTKRAELTKVTTLRDAILDKRARMFALTEDVELRKLIETDSEDLLQRYNADVKSLRESIVRVASEVAVTMTAENFDAFAALLESTIS